jgi:hypothetical protein
MKLQLQSQHLRFRITEAELVRLLDGLPVGEGIRIGAIERQWRMRLHDSAAAQLEWTATDMELCLPRGPVLEYVKGLPRRDGLCFSVAQGQHVLEVEFEVDVRDSVRTRMPRKDPAR